MATKFQMYAQLAQELAEQVVCSREDWTGFLDASARLYKYSFPEQLMIYAQRPDATACAPIEVWNSPMHRWVRRGAKGIALIDENSDWPRLKYVFDVSDTEPAKQNARQPFLWELRQDHETLVRDVLAGTYEGVAENTLPEALYNIASQLAAEYYEDNAREIGYSVESSLLEDYDDLNLSGAFRRAATVSIAYSLMSRCGIDTDEFFTEEDFQPIYEFNTPAAVYALGTAVSDLSEQVLRDIEVTIKKHERLLATQRLRETERSEDNGRDNIHPQRGVPAAQPVPGRTDAASAHQPDAGAADLGQFRPDAAQLPAPAQDDNLQHPAAAGQAAPAPAGDRADSRGEDGADTGRIDTDEPAAGQGQRPDGMDSPHEQPAAAGTGDGAERAGIQLEAEEAEQTPPAQETPAPGGVFASDAGEEDAVAEPATTPPESAPPEPIARTLLGTPFRYEQVDAILRSGGNQRHSVLRIAAQYMKSQSAAENAAFLAREYRAGGKGFQFGEQQVAVWFDETGITLGNGKTALQDIAKAHISWAQAAARIQELLKNGQYLSADVLDEAMDHERREVAQSVLYLYRDMREQFTMPEEWQANGHCFPDELECVKGLLDVPESRAEVINTVERDMAAYLAAPEQRWMYIQRPDRMMQRLRETAIEPVTFPARDTVPSPEYAPFITDDEIDSFFQRHGHYTNGKFSILSYFLQHPTAKEREKYLKKHYGDSGASPALNGAFDSSYEAFRGKLRFTRGRHTDDLSGKVEVALTWNAASKWVARLIEQNRYLLPEERDSIQEYERRELASSIYWCYHGLPEDYTRPFPTDGEWNSESDRKDIAQMLQNPLETETLANDLSALLQATHADDKEYERRAQTCEQLQAYQLGTYTLFPGLAKLSQPAPVTETGPQQLSLFALEPVSELPLPVLPGAEEQQVRIEQSIQQEPAVPTPHVPEVTQADIDTALRQRPKDAAALQEYIQAHGRERGAAAYLQQAYGGGAQFVVRGEDGLDVTLSWPKVQRRVLQLITAGHFLPPAQEQSLTEPPPAQAEEPAAETPGTTPGGIHYDAGSRIRTDDGDIVVTRLGPLFVYYRNADEQSDEETQAGLYRETFEGHLDAGRYRLAEAQPTQDVAGPAAVQVEPQAAHAPPPVFFPDWDTAQGDFDLSRYADGDIVGYNREGVEYAVGRSGRLTYLTQTTTITSWGEVLGNDTIPRHIREQMVAYRNGELTDEAARDAYLAVLAAPTPSEPAPIAGPQDITIELNPHAEVLEQEAAASAPEDEPFLTDEEIAEIREHITNPTAEDEAHIQEMLQFALDANAEFERGMEDAPTEAAPTLPAPANFRITDEHLGEGGAKTKYGYNIAAIRTLRQIEAEERFATPEEQETLSRYVGWGGLSQAFDEGREGWQREYAELKDLLTDEEYSMARASTLNAHYTSPVVIGAMYAALRRLGFQGGNILEPGCGVGNFFGMLPARLQDTTKLYGVELDSITGRIAQQLYPGANIEIAGFENSHTSDAFFDVALGNVPFGNYPVADSRYKQNFSIHEYFFAKALDQVRPGGIVAFVTSKYILDTKSPAFRKYLAGRADLLGAIRLPNNAFLKNAGTEVTADILFLQRRDRVMDIEPDWVHLGATEDGVPVNSYFVEHPEMLLGTMVFDESMFGDKTDTACHPFPGESLAAHLQEAVQNIQGRYEEVSLDDMDEALDESIPADPDVRNFSYCLVEEQLYFREDSRMFPVALPTATAGRVRGMVGLRDCVHKLIDLQLHDYSEVEIRAQQAKLNTLYDAFSKEYGLINSTANSRAFSNDSAYYLLCSLEILDEDGKLERKADMFQKRTIKQKTVVTSVDTASEALAVSIAEKARVDLDYMAELTGFSREKLVEDLRGVIFLNVGNADGQEQTYVTADEYLSGNIREKLELARAGAAALPALAVNVEALEAAMPKDLEASEISVRLGSTWVKPEYIQQFMHGLFQTSPYLQRTIEVHYFDYTGEWQISNKRRVPYSDVLANVTYGTTRMNAYQILEDTLNLRDVRVYDYVEEDGKQKRVLNKNETDKAAQKQQDIKRAFADWVWDDPQRRHDLVQTYNERFNSTRLREYDGSHINFYGMTPDISLREHQLSAIARILYGGNTLLAHEVGAGKTFEMVAACMESKRLGLCQKSLFAVPNHLTEQWAAEFLRLYPSANILVATKKDFEMRNRKKFCAKISTGDFDAVILGHSQLEKIPMSQERQARMLQDQINEIVMALDEIKRNHGEQFTIKQLEKTRKTLDARLVKLLTGKRRDDVVTFEQLGVDRLFVDEAHSYKNLFLHTKMRNVAGISQSEAQKSSDMYMKCQYMDELTGGKGVVFATGTPVSNSMTEMYTMQRYLQGELLARQHLSHFDAWASTFGETVTAIELAPEGTGYRARTRFSKFHNLPELMAMFKEVADIKTADVLNLPTPTAHFETVVVKPSELQKEMVQQLAERAKDVHSGSVDPSVDNMLKITSDGRKIGLDQRLMNPLLPDEEGSKINACMRNVYRIWQETAVDRLTQLVFCDFSTPNKDGRFNVYDDIREKLVARGVPEDEIAFIHDANTEVRKKELFAKVRQGKVRVLFGSTAKLGAGTNVQDKLIAIHDADCPWRPADLAQRAGRIVRQGNNNPEVYIYRYATEGTFDSYLWQTVENKQKFISQIMTSKSPVRACDDVDETALSYAEIKALCAGNPLIKEKIDLDIEVARLRVLKADYKTQHYRLQDDLLTSFPESIRLAEERVAGLQNDIARFNSNIPPKPAAGADGKEAATPFPPMTLLGVTYTKKEDAGKALLDACKTVKTMEPVEVGSYMGFSLNLSFDTFDKLYSVTMKGDLGYKAQLAQDTFGNLTRINNALKDMPEMLAKAKARLDTLYKQVEDAKQELEKPFAQEKELADKELRLAYLNKELDIDNEPPPRQTELAPQAANFKADRPSILEGLRNFGAAPQVVKPEKAPGAEHTI